MNITAIFLDLLFAVTIVMMVYRAYHKGFLQSAIQTLGYIAASVVAFFGGRALSEACYQLFFRDRLRASLENALLASADTNDFTEKIQAATAELPKIVQNLLASAGMGADALADRLSGSVEESAHELSGILLETVLHPLISTLLNGICFLILFTAAMVLVRCLSKAAGGIRHIPLVGSVNALLGGAMGLVQAAVVWFVIAVAVDFLIGATGGFSWLNRQTVTDSFVFGKFFGFVQSMFPQVK